MTSPLDSNNTSEYSPNLIRPSTTGYHIVILGGATRTGKSTRADILTENHGYVYGPKAKFRPDGARKEGDNERPDSLIITPQKLASLKKKGLVLSGAEYEYHGTTYVPLRKFPDQGFSAVPADNHVIYVSGVHDGAMKIKEALAEFSPIPMLLYTRLDALRKRLDASKMDEAEKMRRLQTYAQDFAQFKVRTQDYAFLWYVRDPPIPDDLFLDDSSKQKTRAQIIEDATGIARMVDKLKDIVTKPITYAEVHSAYVNRQIMTLFGKDLPNVARMIDDRQPMKLDFSEHTRRYIDAGNYLNDSEIASLANVEAVRLVSSNGRHTLVLKGLEDPYSSHNNGHKPLEDIMIDFMI